MKDINLMPQDVVKKKRIKMLIKSIIVGTVIVITISLASDVAIFAYKITFDNKIKEQVANIEDRIGAQNDSTIQDVIREKINYKNNVYDNLKKYQFDVAKVLDQIEKTIPIDVAISSLTISTEGIVVVEGKADNENSVLDFFYTIKNSGLTDYVIFEELEGKFGDLKGFEFGFEFQLINIGSDIIEIIEEWENNNFPLM